MSTKRYFEARQATTQKWVVGCVIVFSNIRGLQRSCDNMNNSSNRIHSGSLLVLKDYEPRSIKSESTCMCYVYRSRPAICAQFWGVLSEINKTNKQLVDAFFQCFILGFFDLKCFFRLACHCCKVLLSKFLWRLREKKYIPVIIAITVSKNWNFFMRQVWECSKDVWLRIQGHC